MAVIRDMLNIGTQANLYNYVVTDEVVVMVNGINAWDDTPPKLYYYDVTSVATDDGENVIKPIAVMGAGRYIKLVKTQNQANWTQANTNAPDYIANKPTLTSGTVTSVGITSSADLTISGSPVTSSGSIGLDLNTTGVSAGTYTSVTVNTKGRVTAATNPTRVMAAVSRSLVTTTASTGFQISTTRDYSVNYSIYAQVTSALIGTNTADVFLEIATTNSTTPADWTTISRSGISAAGVVNTTGNTQTVGGFVPAGYYVRLRTAATGANSGASVFTYQVGQENSY